MQIDIFTDDYFRTAGGNAIFTDNFLKATDNRNTNSTGDFLNELPVEIVFH